MWYLQYMCLAIQTRSEEKGAFLKRRLGFRNAWFFIEIAIFWKIEQDDSFWKKAPLLTWQNAITSAQKLTRKGAFLSLKWYTNHRNASKKDKAPFSFQNPIASKLSLTWKYKIIFHCQSLSIEKLYLKWKRRLIFLWSIPVVCILFQG